jgi:hypothetical protein
LSCFFLVIGCSKIFFRVCLFKNLNIYWHYKKKCKYIKFYNPFVCIQFSLSLWYKNPKLNNFIHYPNLKAQTCVLRDKLDQQQQQQQQKKVVDHSIIDKKGKGLGPMHRSTGPVEMLPRVQFCTVFIHVAATQWVQCSCKLDPSRSR